MDNEITSLLVLVIIQHNVGHSTTGQEVLTGRVLLVTTPYLTDSVELCCTTHTCLYIIVLLLYTYTRGHKTDKRVCNNSVRARVVRALSYAHAHTRKNTAG